MSSLWKTYFPTIQLLEILIVPLRGLYYDNTRFHKMIFLPKKKFGKQWFKLFDDANKNIYIDIRALLWFRL